MCRCESDECCNLRAEYIDSRFGRLVAEQADPSHHANGSMAT
jgi:hypothetical protein